MIYVTYFSLFFLSSLTSFCLSIELLSGLVTAIGVGSSIFTYNYIKCRNSECCDDDWIHFDALMLKENFRKKLFGQSLAETVILKSLQGFFKDKNSKKPLVLAFHGLTGSGKNYATQMIANSTFKNGMDSYFVHLYIATRDFPHVKEVSKYQDRIRQEIPQFTKECSRSLFIFDEIDKMPPGTLDALKPFIDYHEKIDNVDYRKNLFIFLSNSGSRDITNLALNFWAEGRDREEITMRDIEPLINKGAFNEKGGFQFSELLRSELIDVFVPFLPLERKHVNKCIEEELKAQNREASKDLINKIADHLVYFPAEVEIYAKSGCKRLKQKVHYFLDE